MISKTAAGTWHVRICQGGQQKAAKTFRTRKPAEAWEREQKDALANGSWFDARRGKKQLGVVISEFNDARKGLIAAHTWATDEANLRLHVSAALKRLSIGSVTTEDLEGELNAVIRTRSKGTASRVPDALVALFGYALDRKLVPTNVALPTKLAKGTGTVPFTVRPFAPVELADLLSAVEDGHAEYARLAEFMALTGLRWGEARELRRGDIALGGSVPVVHVRRSRSDGFEVRAPKSGRARRVPLIDRAVQIAELQGHQKQPNDLLFTSPRGRQIAGNNYKRDSHWAKLTSHRIHDLRHTAATNWILLGVDVKTVSSWLGHSTPAITLRVYAGWFGEGADGAALERLRGAAATAMSARPSLGSTGKSPTNGPFE